MLRRPDDTAGHPDLLVSLMEGMYSKTWLVAQCWRVSRSPRNPLWSNGVETGEELWYLEGGVGRRGQAVTDWSQAQAPQREEGWEGTFVIWSCSYSSPFFFSCTSPPEERGCPPEPSNAWRRTVQRMASRVCCTWRSVIYQEQDHRYNVMLPRLEGSVVTRRVPHQNS